MSITPRLKRLFLTPETVKLMLWHKEGDRESQDPNIMMHPSDGDCDGTSQVIRPTYSCPCPTDIRHPVDVPKSLDKFGIFPYLTRNVSPVLQTLQNIGDKEMRKRIT
jgi:hypothetical protein